MFFFVCLYCICSYLHAAFVFVPIAVGFVGDMYTQKWLQALPSLLKLHRGSNFVFQCICICFEFAFDFFSHLNFLILWKPVLGRHTQEGFWAFTFRLEFYSKAFLCVFCISFCFFFFSWFEIFTYSQGTLGVSVSARIEVGSSRTMRPNISCLMLCWLFGNPQRHGYTPIQDNQIIPIPTKI